MAKAAEYRRRVDLRIVGRNEALQGKLGTPRQMPRIGKMTESGAAGSDRNADHNVHWTLPMALAWLIWRDDQAVKDQWDWVHGVGLPLDTSRPGRPRQLGRTLAARTPGTLASLFAD